MLCLFLLASQSIVPAAACCWLPPVQAITVFPTPQQSGESYTFYAYTTASSSTTTSYPAADTDWPDKNSSFSLPYFIQIPTARWPWVLLHLAAGLSGAEPLPLKTLGLQADWKLNCFHTAMSSGLWHGSQLLT